MYTHTLAIRNGRVRSTRLSKTTKTYFGVDADGLVAFVARVGEYRFVAFYAVRMLVPKYVSLSRQRFVALPATEVTGMPVLVHSLRVFSTENQLKEDGTFGTTT